MHLRPTTPADGPRLATIRDGAFDDNDLTEFLNPNRRQYPASWREHALLTQRQAYYKPSVRGYVCVADAADGFAPAGEILGYARWGRRAGNDDDGVAGAGDPFSQDRTFGLRERIESWLCWAESKYASATERSNPAVSPERLQAFLASVAHSTIFAPLSGMTRWHLEVLAVAPEYQRRGVARALVGWGLERARAETEARAKRGKPPVPVTLIATEPGIYLYRAMGFKVVGWQDDSFLPARTVGGSSCVWDSTGYWVQDVEWQEPMKRGVIEAVLKNPESKGEEGEESQEGMDALVKVGVQPK